MSLVRTIKGLISAVLLFNVLLWVPSTRLFCLYALGRSSHCSMQQAMHSFNTIARRAEIMKELDRGKKVIQKDSARFNLLETSLGRVLVAARNDENLIFNLAQQAT